MALTELRDKYLAYLRFELNLSANTCQAYLQDVDKLLSYIEAEGIDLGALDYPRLQHFLSTLYDLDPPQLHRSHHLGCEELRTLSPARGLCRGRSYRPTRGTT